MKYFIDFEFIEGFKKPLFGNRRHFIDMISVGIVAEDGRSYYAISNEFNPKDIYDSTDANEAIRIVALESIVKKWVMSYSGDGRNYAIDRIENKSLSKQLRVIQSHIGKPNEQIANEIIAFIYPEIFIKFKGAEQEFYSRSKEYGWDVEAPEFYGYYSDYDWVLFCSLFGRMIDLPKGFPMVCYDLQQTLAEKIIDIHKDHKKALHYNLIGSLDPKTTLARNIERFKNHADFPKQSNEHNALEDAKWNKELYEFLNKL